MGNNRKNLGMVVNIDEEKMHVHLVELTRGTVEETLNTMLEAEAEAEAEALCNAQHIKTWRIHPIKGKYPYLYIDGIVLMRSKMRARSRTSRCLWLSAWLMRL